jgi:alpha-1,6-mannosyltransferase
MPQQIRPLLLPAVLIELFVLGLFAVIPVGGVTLSLSPLARAWPWLLAPARLLAGNQLVDGSVPPEQNLASLALVAVLLVGASCAAGLAVLRAPRSAPGGRRLLVILLGITLLFGMTMLLLPTLPSDDIFSYILYGRISAIHHANPLVAVPSDFPNDPFLTRVFWRDVRSVYGTVWLMLSSGLSLLAEAFGGSLLSYVLSFKLLGLAAHIVNAWLIWRILGVLSPQWRLRGTLLYAWNPLCLLEFCASGHNDAVMLSLLLVGVYCLVRQWEVAALVAFGLSISIKYVPVVLLPFYLVWIAHSARARGLDFQGIAKELAWRAGVLAAVVIAVTIPYWAGPQTVGALLFSPPAQQLNNSLLESISWPLRSLTQGLLGLSVDAARTLVDTTLKAAALLVFLILWLREFRRARSLEGMLRAWGWVLLWYVLVASGWFWPWYVTWAVAIVALLPWTSLTTATLLLAGGSLTLYGFLPLHAAAIYGYRSVVAFGPALGYLLWLEWSRYRHREDISLGKQSARGNELDGKQKTEGPLGEFAKLP